MSSCGVSVTEPSYTDGSKLEVIEKFKALMIASLGDDSIYNKSKETFAHIFSDLQVTEAERASMTAQNISQLASSITGQAMGTALQWAKEEVNSGAELALIKAQAHKAVADVSLTEEQICNLQADTCHKNANAIAVSSKAIREYGEVATSDGCIATSLKDEGLVLEQQKQINATTYATLAKTYREHGEVHVHFESNLEDSDGHGYLKGYAGNVASRTNGYGWDLSYGSGLSVGYTNAQMLVAERQRLGFEDNKLQHAANSSSQMISQLLGSEDVIDLPSGVFDQYIAQWSDIMSALQNRSSCNPSCSN